MRFIMYNVFVPSTGFWEIKFAFEIHVKKGLYMASHFKKLMVGFRKT
jgi:hypothetical protein